MRRGARVTLLIAALGASAGSASAHELSPPREREAPPAVWPAGHDHGHAHDAVVPVELVVDAEGRVEQVVLETSLSPELDRAAMAAAAAWTFEPATRDGVPVSARIRAFVRFLPPPAESLTQASPVREPPKLFAADAPTVRVIGAPPARSASETVRARDLVSAAPHRTASDVLRVVPGVAVTQHSGEGKAAQIFYRGFDSVHGQDLELWVGGVPINEASNIHGQGYADLNFVMPEVVRQIHVTPGTYDPRQGDFAVGGSMRFDLGYAEPGATVKGTVGSYGARRLFFAYRPKEASDQTFAAFEGYETDGFGPSRAARRGSAVVQTTHDFDSGLALRLLATTYGSRFDSAGVVRRADVDAGRIDRFASMDPDQGGLSSRTNLLVELHRDGQDAKWRVAPFVALRSLQLRQNFTGERDRQENDSVTAGVTASYRKALRLLSPRDSLEVGVYGRQDSIQQAQRRVDAAGGNPSTLVDATASVTNAAGWVDAAVHPWRPLAVRGGVRADVFAIGVEEHATGAQARAADGAHLGKKATADLVVVPRVHVVASYGEGFRSPQARSVGDRDSIPFTEVRGGEVGVRYADGAHLGASAAAFYTALSDDLVFDHATTRLERTPATARKGLAVEGTARAGQLFVAQTSATYTHAAFTASGSRFAEGELVPYVPQVVLRTDLAMRGTVGRVLSRDLVGRVGTGLEGLMRRPLAYGESGSDVFVVDASAGLRLREIELGLDVFNVLDAAYYDSQFVYASNFERSATPSLMPSRHVTIGPPRTVWLSLTLFL
jgi:TonB family protein